MTRAQAPAAAGTVDLELPFHAESAHVARDRLLSWLTSTPCSPERCDDARLVVSELVGNAVRHARPLSDGTMHVTWGHGGPESADVVIAVSDGGSPTSPQRLEAGASEVSGRGLSIVEALAARWWVEATRTRTTVHAVVSLA